MTEEVTLGQPRSLSRRLAVGVVEGLVPSGVEGLVPSVAEGLVPSGVEGPEDFSEIGDFESVASGQLQDTVASASFDDVELGDELSNLSIADGRVRVS